VVVKFNRAIKLNIQAIFRGGLLCNSYLSTSFFYSGNSDDYFEKSYIYPLSLRFPRLELEQEGGNALFQNLNGFIIFHPHLMQLLKNIHLIDEPLKKSIQYINSSKSDEK
jgi:hypothetical protein